MWLLNQAYLYTAYTIARKEDATCVWCDGCCSGTFIAYIDLCVHALVCRSKIYLWLRALSLSFFLFLLFFGCCLGRKSVAARVAIYWSSNARFFGIPAYTLYMCNACSYAESSIVALNYVCWRGQSEESSFTPRRILRPDGEMARAVLYIFFLWCSTKSIYIWCASARPLSPHPCRMQQNLYTHICVHTTRGATQSLIPNVFFWCPDFRLINHPQCRRRARIRDSINHPDAVCAETSCDATLTHTPKVHSHSPYIRAIPFLSLVCTTWTHKKIRKEFMCQYIAGKFTIYRIHRISIWWSDGGLGAGNYARNSQAVAPTKTAKTE